MTTPNDDRADVVDRERVEILETVVDGLVEDLDTLGRDLARLELQLAACVAALTALVEFGRPHGET